MTICDRLRALGPLALLVCATAAPAEQAQEVKVLFGKNGPTSIQYGGQEWLEDGQAVFSYVTFETVKPGKDGGKQTTCERVNLRNATGTFAPAEKPRAAVIADLAAAFRKLHPPLNDWPDRRPIGMLMLHSGNKSKTNPRGWMKKADLDTTTPAGKAQLRKYVLDFAERSVKSMKAFNAQGGVLWNIEGEENPHPITYIGDPRMLPVLAPEMDALADDFFRVFRQAGLRTGVCIRPTQIYRKGDKWSHGTGRREPWTLPTFRQVSVRVVLLFRPGRPVRIWPGAKPRCRCLWQRTGTQPPVGDPIPGTPTGWSGAIPRAAPPGLTGREQDSGGSVPVSPLAANQDSAPGQILDGPSGRKQRRATAAVGLFPSRRGG